MAFKVAGWNEIAWNVGICYLKIAIVVIVDVVYSGGSHLFDNLRFSFFILLLLLFCGEMLSIFGGII